MIIDAHIHVGPWTHADFLGLENDVRSTLAMLRSAGIDGAVLMTADTCRNEALIDEVRAAVGEGLAPGPLWLMSWVRPCDGRGIGEADLELVRRRRKNLSGLKIHPSLSRVRITDETFRPCLELAAELDLVVLIHCGRWKEIASYEFALEVAARYPTVRFLLAHGGGDTPPNAMGTAEGIARAGLKNVWIEFSGLREYWVVERGVALIGAERYLMGSDYPLAHPLMYLGSIQAMRLPEEAKDLIRGGNALRLFGAPLHV